MLVNIPPHLVLHSAGDQSQGFVHELRRALHQLSYNLSLKVHVSTILPIYLLSSGLGTRLGRDFGLEYLFVRLPFGHGGIWIDQAGLFRENI